MVIMSATEAWPAAGQPFTVDELDLMPDDGRRYELLDGVLIVSPRPRTTQQEAAAELLVVLRAACPPELRVFAEPAVQVSPVTEFDPNIVVVRQDQLGRAKVTEPPLLIVEVRSPSSALIDLNRKKSAYAKFGVPSYWIVNPDPDRPDLTVFELDGSEYREAGRVSGANPSPAQKPSSVEVVPP